MPKRGSNSIFKEASKLRREYPRRFKTWKEYVAQASAIYASKHGGKSPIGKKRKVKKSPRKKTVNVVPGHSLGMISTKKKLEAKLGWLYVNRDNAKTKTLKRKYQREINKIKALLREP